MRGAITSYIDVAQIVLYAFWFFFAGLIYYLRQEDRREGYPLESETAIRPKGKGALLIPRPKIFNLGHGRTVSAPAFTSDDRVLKAAKREPWPGAPLEPVGDPMLAEVGPGAYAQRADVPDRMHDGRDLIVPLRIATDFAVAKEDSNPVGFAVHGADGVRGGTVRDIWVDRGESMARYYEVEVAGGKRVLLPVPFSLVSANAKRVNVQAILGSQFANVPATKSLDRVTLLEEEKVVAYYGAGTLYATPERSEPLI